MNATILDQPVKVSFACLFSSLLFSSTSTITTTYIQIGLKKHWQKHKFVSPYKSILHFIRFYSLFERFEPYAKLLTITMIEIYFRMA